MEISISLFNNIDTNSEKRRESTNALSTIKRLLDSSDQVKGLEFAPTSALVVTWRNTIPTPAFFFSGREVQHFNIDDIC